MHCDLPSIILDILNVADAETAVIDTNDDSKERQNFCYIVRECEKVIIPCTHINSFYFSLIFQFLSDKLLKERLEIDTLQEVGILKNRNFYTKFIKVKTKL